ncbi:MAG TPA: zf-HC2 domain-containing protein [Vicinamibacteria bacterium]|nr:zf-HC2 domain-containing protein [Vicinamibacteria bacterium]
MLCREDEKISVWIDGELSREEADEVAIHVEGCSSCRELAASFQSLREGLRLDVEPDPGFVVRFRERRDEPLWKWRRVGLRLLPFAVGALVAALIVVWAAAQREPDLTVLEREAIGNDTVFALATPEPVLLIALEPFPGEVP